MARIQRDCVRRAVSARGGVAQRHGRAGRRVRGIAGEEQGLMPPLPGHAHLPDRQEPPVGQSRQRFDRSRLGPGGDLRPGAAGLDPRETRTIAADRLLQLEAHPIAAGVRVLRQRFRIPCPPGPVPVLWPDGQGSDEGAARSWPLPHMKSHQYARIAQRQHLAGPGRQQCGYAAKAGIGALQLPAAQVSERADPPPPRHRGIQRQRPRGHQQRARPHRLRLAGVGRRQQQHGQRQDDQDSRHRRPA